MSEAVRAEVAALRAVAPRFDELARRLSEVASVLTERSAAEGACWGCDEPGATLASGYLPGSDAAMRGIGVTTHKLTGIGTALRVAADEYERIDLATAAALAGR